MAIIPLLFLIFLIGDVFGQGYEYGTNIRCRRRRGRREIKACPDYAPICCHDGNGCCYSDLPYCCKIPNTEPYCSNSPTCGSPAENTERVQGIK